MSPKEKITYDDVMRYILGSKIVNQVKLDPVVYTNYNEAIRLINIARQTEGYSQVYDEMPDYPFDEKLASKIVEYATTLV